MLDRELEERLKKIESAIASLHSAQQLPATTTLAQLIDAVNKITDSLKRRR